MKKYVVWLCPMTVEAEGETEALEKVNKQLDAINDNLRAQIQVDFAEDGILIPLQH